MDTDLLYTLALTYVPGLGPVNQRKILKKISAKEVWDLNEKELNLIFRERKELANHFLDKNFLQLAQSELEFCDNEGIQAIPINSAQYPQKLKECSDSPIVLFKKGNYNFENKIYLGVVGTRKMTSYGKKFIENFINEINGHKITIVSGLAFGCDIEAHRNSILHQIPNLAVLAHGLNRISPSGHKKEANELLKNGALLTEYSSFHNADPINFVLRNRIIAGLSDAIIVVESDVKGGAMATSQYANSYNREVFAVPGRTDDKYSKGCNFLIQSNQACLIRNAKDVLEYFQVKEKPQQKQTELFLELEPDERLIYESLQSKGKQQIDQLAINVGIPIFHLNGILLNMELRGLIRPIPGKYFEIF